MIAGIIDWSLRNRLFVLAAAGLLVLWGGYQTTRMPVDVFPDLTAPAVTIVAEARGMAPTEIETLVAFPIETALNGAAGVRRVRSATKVGITVVIVEFDWGTELYRARQVVAERLQVARNALPPDLPPPVMAPAASIMGEIMFIALVSDRHGPADLKTTADFVLRRRLLAVPGVAEVLPIGGETLQFQVSVKPERLALHHLTLDEVVRAVAGGNQNASAGFVVQSGQEYLIHGLGRIVRPEEIGEAVVAVRDGQPVLVRQVADVGTGYAPRRGVGAHNGKPAVVLAIQKQPGANTLELTAQLDRTMADIQASLPQGMRIETHVFRQADFIATSIDNLLAALRDGAILVVAIVFAFLLSARATFVTLLAIPLSLVVAILVLQLLGATLNTMTLGGMAIALGALVDDAIIVVENVARRLRQNAALADGERRPVTAVVRDATHEIQGSIVFATLVIMLVFLPLFFLSGVEGRLLAPLGLAYVVALAASLLVAVTVTPAAASVLLPSSRTVRRAVEPRFVRSLKAGYRRLLAATVLRWRGIAALSLAALVAAVTALVGAGRAFLPEFNEGSLTVNAATLPGTSLDESDRLGRMIEEIVRSHPEVVATARRTGNAPLDPHAQDVSASEIEVSLKRAGRSKAEFLAALRRDLAAVPGTNITVGQPISHRIDHMLSGSRSNVAVKIFGTDLYELRRIATAVRAIVQAVPGAVDVVEEVQSDVPFLTVRFRRDALARHGLSVRDASQAIETAFAGRAVSRVLQGQASFDLVVRYDPAVRETADAVRATLITTPSGARLPLSAIADIRNERGPHFISRENVQRKIVVMANVAGRDLKGVVDEVRSRVAGQVRLPAGYYIEYGGQFERAEEATRTLLALGAAVTVGVFLLLFVALRSARDATLVMLNLPLALIGGVAGLYVSAGVLSVASIIGFITLFGIATRNGVMMIAHIHHLVEKEGVHDPLAAVTRGAEERLVPILMTALAAGLALVPLALSAGEPGSEIQAPMAIVILFGLASSTVLNMIVVPALYLRFGSFGAATHRASRRSAGAPAERPA